jgi:filamentous hemagglutinin family protein
MGARVIVGGSFGLLGLLLGAMPGLGQSITLDGTVGLVRPLGNGPFYAIRQTDGTTVGTNLFHSFGRFNLATGERAVFQSSATIQTILARVTGGTTSSIDGLILTNSGAVNLFLINPAGIVFGPNASLDIGGTTRGDFTATTLDAITWPDGSQFNAVNPSGVVPLLRIMGNPSGVLASQRQIPKITIDQSVLQVQDGQAFRLLGGAVEVIGGPLGRLDAWGGRVEIGAVAGPGTVALLGTDVQFPSDLVRGDVRFTDEALVDVRSGNRGDLTILGRDIEVLSGSVLGAGIFNNLGTATSQAGLLQLDATGTVTIAGAFSRVANDVKAGATGRGGTLEIRARDVVVRDGAALSTSTAGTGDAGMMRIAARDSVLFQDSLAFSNVVAGATGQGGNVEISTGSLVVRDGAQLIASTNGRGDAGTVAINARDSVLFQTGFALSNLNAGAMGRGGNVEISTGSLVVRDGSQLAAATFGKGDAGNVTINARDSVLFQTSYAFSNVTAGATGQGGNVAISAGSLIVRDRSGLLASTFGKGDAGNVTINARDNVLFQNGSALSSVEAGATGHGGTVAISTGSLVVRDRSGLLASTDSLGDAGNVTINARDSVLFQDGYAFSNVLDGATGQGGNVAISAGSLVVRDGGGLLSSTGGMGDAGDVVINARDNVLFRDGYAFSIVAAGATGQGGNVAITTGRLVVSDGAALAASTLGRGDAGDVEINARDRVLLDGTDPITGGSSAIFTSNGSISNQGIAIGGTGRGGDVNVIAPNLQVSNGAVIDSRTVNNQSGGTITLNLGNLALLGGGQILSTSDGSGPAGTVRINATDGIQIAGRDPTYADRLARFGTTAVDPITAASGIYVRSTDTGAAGNVIIGDRGTTPSLFLDGGEIVADSNAVTGGNVNLTLNQFLFMQNGSLISATAGRAQGAGDGGNITINGPFALAVPQENNDIIANAFSGSGGNITINADAILNFTLNDKGKSFEQLRSQPTNDISASSQFGSNGTLNLAGLNVDPSRGSVQLPIGLVDSADRLDTPCLATSKTSQGSFIITGRGGLVASPDSWRGAVPISDWLSLAPGTIQAGATVPSSAAQPSPVLEANQWQRTPQGQIQFIATSATTLPRYQHPHCATRFAPLAEE